MSSLDILFPHRILFGIDSINRAGELVRTFGPRAMIITEAAVHDNPYLNQLKSVLARSAVQTLVFDEIDAASGTEVFHNILNMTRASKPSAVLALGGMKALTMGRTLACLAEGKVSLERYLAGEELTGPGLPFISIPSTCRDHFLAQNSFVMTDHYRQRPVLLASPDAMIRYVILDPKISTALSAKYYSVVVMDVLLAAAEAYLSNHANFLADTQALGALDKISGAYLDLAHSPKDIRPRIKMAEAGLLSGLALGISSQGIGGAISYAANSRFGIPKSWAATALLPHILDLHAGHQPARVAAIAQALGEDTETLSPEDGAAKASRAVRRIIARLDLPSRLRDFNFSVDMVPELAEIALELPFLRHVPFAVNHQLLYDLIKQAF